MSLTAVTAVPVLHVVNSSQPTTQLLSNGADLNLFNREHLFSWHAWQQGFRLVESEGHQQSRAVSCERDQNGGQYGASQTLALNRTHILPLILRGWSKADNVSGSADSSYSLYADIIYTDGTPLWGQNAGFTLWHA